MVAVRRAIGMVFQKPNPFPTMSIFDNVAAGLRLERAPRRRPAREGRERRCAEPACGRRSPSASTSRGAGLSGGQQQRLCIARSLAVEPEVILMDEPCSALDPIATLKIEELIDELKQRVTIVIVTHNMQQAARVADRTAFMLDGGLVEVGADAGDLHQAKRPANRGICHRQVRLTIRARGAARTRLRKARRQRPRSRRAAGTPRRDARTSRPSCASSRPTRSAAST